MYFCVSCFSGKEQTIQDALIKFLSEHLENDFKVWFPMKEATDKKGGISRKVMHPMFPGYLFIFYDSETEDDFPFRDAKKIPHLVRFLRYDDGRHALMGKDLLFARWIHKNEGTIVESKVLLTEGQRLHIAEGPLVGFDGNVVKVDKHHKKITVRFNFDGNDLDVNFSVQFLEKNAVLNTMKA